MKNDMTKGPFKKPGTLTPQDILSVDSEHYRPPVFPLPNYKTGDYGDWRLETTVELEAEKGRNPSYMVQPGYFRGYGLEEHYHLLRNKEDGAVWMVTSILEQESHMAHLSMIEQVGGTVVIVGVGMGMALKEVASMPLVDRIIAIDISPDVIGLLKDATDFEEWEGRDKIEFLVADALDLEGRWDRSIAVDYLYVDIWPTLSNDNDVPDVQKIQKVVNAKLVSWWGMEIDFYYWAMNDSYARKRMDSTPNRVPKMIDWDRYALSTKLPMVRATSNYLKRIRDAALIFGLRDEDITVFEITTEPGVQPVAQVINK